MTNHYHLMQAFGDTEVGQPYLRDHSLESTPEIEALQLTVEQARKSALYKERLGGVRIRSAEEFRKLPLTKRSDLQEAGIHGTRAAPLEEICHYGETSGTSGQSNSTWLTAHDFARNAKTMAARHPDVFAPGRILLNRFPFMAAPAHLLQLIAQMGSGVSIPAGNINWDVPFGRALDLAYRTGAQTLAGFPFEPVILERLARARGLDPTKDLALDTFFLGGSPLPPVLQRRIEKLWDARVIELYGSTETMLLGTGCSQRTLHLETDLVHCEILRLDSDEPAGDGEVGRLIVTTLGLEGSPLVRFDTGDCVRSLPPCKCGDSRPSLVVLGRVGDEIDLEGRRVHAYEMIEAAAAAADAVDSSIFFNVVLPDRLLVRIEAEKGSTREAEAALHEHLGQIRVEVEFTESNLLLDTETLTRSPSVYKPVLISDWRRSGRRLMSVHQGMMEWPKLSAAEALRWLRRTFQTALRRRRLGRQMRGWPRSEAGDIEGS